MAMLEIYKSNTDGSKLKQLTNITSGCWINLIQPTDMELENISQKLQIPKVVFQNALDDEEHPHIDSGDKYQLFIVDVPYIHEKNQYTSVRTKPLCIMIIENDYFVTLSLQQTEVLNDFKNNKIKDFHTAKKSRFMIQLLYRVATLYIKYLNIIHEHMEKAENKMMQATKNNELVRLMGLEKSLVYITTSLKANGIVLDKILKGNTIDLYDEDLELLEDAIIENDQGIETSNLYREILSSMTDTFATIISNNLNVIMKFLAGITIVLSIPTMVASFMGMNVPLGVFKTNPYSFLLLILISVLLSLLVAYWLKKKDML